MEPTKEQLFAAVQWLMSGDSGTSSESILGLALGVKPRDFGHMPPSDPSDLGRCLRMLKALPWVEPLAMPKMRKNPAWKKTAAHWQELAQAMADEVGIDWSKGQSAPKTYARMRAIQER